MRYLSVVELWVVCVLGFGILQFIISGFTLNGFMYGAGLGLCIGLVPTALAVMVSKQNPKKQGAKR